MAYIKAQIFSEIINQDLYVDLFLPSDSRELRNSEPKAVIYLLHGMSGNNSAWFNLCPLVRYASENNVVIVSPQGHNSFYVNQKLGVDYFKYMTDELPVMLDKLFKIPKGRDKTFVAGLSMGGYGALLLGLSRPDLFAACASFSGAVGIAKDKIATQDENFIRSYMMPIFGENLEERDELNLYLLAEKVSKMKEDMKPNVLCTCGINDFLYEDNIEFKNYMKNLDINFRYMEWEGEHEGGFWDRSLVYAIDYFLDSNYADKIHNAWSYKVNIEE